MNCLRNCTHLVPARGSEPEYENPIISHWQVSEYGHNFYFCATHRVYHCIFIDGSLDQPFCGECGPIYYQGFPNVIWDKDHDRPAEQPATQHVMASGHELMRLNLHAPANPFALPSPGDFPDDEIQVPRDDPTYQGLGTVLVGNPRQRSLWRLSFRSYAGALGWMPCGRDIGQRAEFLVLAEHEQHGDHVFKQARLWACQAQGHFDLHKDIRWVLWNIYMLSNDVLYNSQETNEQVIWNMRGWLHSLYVTAANLFDYHQIQIPVPMPEHDWLVRPIGLFNPPVAEAEQEAMGAQPNSPIASDMDSDDTVDLAMADLTMVDELSSGEDTPDEGDSDLDF